MAQQSNQCVACVEVALVMFEVLMRQQNLCNGESKGGEKTFVSGHQSGLADRGTGQQFGQVCWSAIVSECPHTCTHRARGNEDYFFAGLALLRNLSNQLFHLGQVRLLPAVGKHARAQLDDEPGDLAEQLGAHGECGTKAWQGCRD